MPLPVRGPRWHSHLGSFIVRFACIDSYEVRDVSWQLVAWNGIRGTVDGRLRAASRRVVHCKFSRRSKNILRNEEGGGDLPRHVFTRRTDHLPSTRPTDDCTRMTTIEDCPHDRSVFPNVHQPASDLIIRNRIGHPHLATGPGSD